MSRQKSQNQVEQAMLALMEVETNLHVSGTSGTILSTSEIKQLTKIQSHAIKILSRVIGQVVRILKHGPIEE